MALKTRRLTKSGRPVRRERRDPGRAMRMAHENGVLEVPCPDCGTPAGELCVWPKAGRSKHSHKARHDLWKASPAVPAPKVTLPIPPWH